ncbi:hypothetical protein CQ065_23730 [Pseudomonas sp. MYb187]|nr:hypothetical protein CQ065_23730 [Pseudomonas sp. MYb187]
MVKHVRILGQRQPDDLYNELIMRDLEIPRQAMVILNEPITNNRESVVHRAGIVLQARAEEFGHEYPNTVMFMDLTTLQQVCTTLDSLPSNRQDFNCRVRIPWIVTWKGVSNYEVIENASGFAASTDDNGYCNHYRAPLTDAQSYTNNWSPKGL